MSIDNPSLNPFTVYLPGLPMLSNSEQDLPLCKTVTAAREDLARQLAASGIHAPNVFSSDTWLQNMAGYDKADGLLFPPMTGLPINHPNHKIEAAKRWFDFFSLITGVHVGNPHQFRENGVSKPCVVMDPDGQWNQAIDLLKDLKAKGMFSSEVDDIVQVIPSKGDYSVASDYQRMNAEAVAALKDRIEHPKGKNKSDSKNGHGKYASQHFEPFRKKITRHPFGVSMFGSATTTEPSYIAASEELARMIGERGWRMVDGSGKAGCMGASDRGFMQGKNSFNERYPDAEYKPAHISVSTLPILQFEGQPENIDQLVIVDNIYDRMKAIIKGQRSSDEKQRLRDASKVIFVAPGGTGTLHEFTAMMALATNGDMMEGRTVVLLNVPSHIDPTQGFWDPLIKTAKALGLGDHFVVANSPKEAIDIADDIYTKWLERHEEFPNLPHPVLNPNPKTNFALKTSRFQSSLFSL